jgi:hypothetical protein
VGNKDGQTANESVKTTRPGRLSMAAFEVTTHGRFSGDHRGTWDKLHFWILDNENPSWDALDPSVLGDILSLVRPEFSEEPLASPSIIALSLSEEATKKGALVWDTLIRLERGSLHDAELLAKAQAFKKAFLADKVQGLGEDDIAQAWIKWKDDKHV